MSKRYFKINMGNCGGELTIGQVNKDFVDFWRYEDEDELVEYLMAGFDDEDSESESPKLLDKNGEEISAWFEADDILHVNGAYSDCDVTVQEITLNDGVELTLGEALDEYADEFVEIGDEDACEYVSSFGREAYTQGKDQDEEEWVPVLQVHTSEKGGFGNVYVVTDGEDFNNDKLIRIIVETDLGEIVERVFYDRVELDIDHQSDTRGISTTAQVRWINLGHVDAACNEESIEDHFIEVYADLADQEAEEK